MFSNITSVIEKYRQTVENERKKYLPYYNFLDNVNQLVVGERGGVDNNYKYKLLCGNDIFLVSNRLINKLYSLNAIDNQFLNLICHAPEFIYKIFIRGRLLCEIVNINYKMKLDNFKFIKEDKSAYALHKLITLVKNNYNLTDVVDEDDSLLSTTGGYIDETTFRFAVGGGSVVVKSPGWTNKGAYKSFISQQLKDLYNIIKVQPCVFVGDIALWIDGHLPTVRSLEVISIDSLELVKIVCDEYERQHGVRPTYKKEKTNIMSDIRLRKYNVSIDGRAVCTIFNNGKYEVVPYRDVDGIKVGGRDVIITFLLINLYIIKVLLNSGIVKDRSIVDTIVGKIESVKNEGERKRHTDYYGVFISEDVYLKKKVKKIQLDAKKYGEYYPYIYEVNFDKLREV